MADFSTLIASIEATIKENGVQAITGQVLQDELLAMVAAINQLKQDTLEGYAFYGESFPNGATRVVTQNTFFLAGAGSYTINGNAVTITDSGISVIVYDCVNDEITTYQLFAYDANPISGSANAVTSGGVKSALDTKADKNGASPDLFAGFAGNLVDTRSAGTRQQFAFRQSGGDGVNYMRKILGRTEAWNQSIVENKSNVYYTFNNGSTIVVTSTPSSFNGEEFRVTSWNTIAGHKYYARIVSDVSAGYFFLKNYYSSLSPLNTVTSQSGGVVVTETASWELCLGFSGVAAGTYKIAIILVDLTLEYGAGNEPSTVAEFEALHPLPYYNYNAGVLKNNAATGLETRGFNQWDEEAELGAYDDSTGAPTVSAVNLRSKKDNPISVFPNTAYCFFGGLFRVLFYDSEMNFISKVNVASGNTKTTPANCFYIRFYMNTGYGTTYNNDICINLSDASRNGEYEPYWKRDIVLGLDNLACHDENNNAVVVNGLDGVGTAQDELIVENGWGTKIIKRRGRRAYQAGDESDATLMTDGTNTDYPLATPKVLTLDNPIPALIEVDNLGTEKRLPEDTADNPQAPFECDSNYSISTANLVRKLSE